jgi:phytoene dehydrogenase-like protein
MENLPHLQHAIFGRAATPELPRNDPESSHHRQRSQWPERAITLARAGVEVAVFEARPTIGGGVSTGEVTLPGFRHDLGSSIYPMGIASPFFQSLPLADHGLRWIEPRRPRSPTLFDDGTAVLLEHDIAATAANLGPDAAAYTRVVRPLAGHFQSMQRNPRPSYPHSLAPDPHCPLRHLRRAPRQPYSPKPSSAANAPEHFSPASLPTPSSPLESPFSAAVGLVLGAAGHAKGWPIAAGGAQSISDALASYLEPWAARS